MNQSVTDFVNSVHGIKIVKRGYGVPAETYIVKGLWGVFVVIVGYVLFNIFDAPHVGNIMAGGVMLVGLAIMMDAILTYCSDRESPYYWLEITDNLSYSDYEHKIEKRFDIMCKEGSILTVKDKYYA